MRKTINYLVDSQSGYTANDDIFFIVCMRIKRQCFSAARHPYLKHFCTSCRKCWGSGSWGRTEYRRQLLESQVLPAVTLPNFLKETQVFSLRRFAQCVLLPRRRTTDFVRNVVSVSVSVHAARVKSHNWRSNLDALQRFETCVFFLQIFSRFAAYPHSRTYETLEELAREARHIEECILTGREYVPPPSSSLLPQWQTA